MKETNTNVLKLFYQGKRSSLFLYSHPVSGERMVVKVANKGLGFVANQKKLANEYNCMKMLDHPAFRKAKAFDASKLAQGLVMEYVDGETIIEHFVNHRDNWPYFLKIAIEIVKAVEVIHHLHIVHLDLTGYNILVERNGFSVKIIDFSSASFLKSREPLMLSQHKVDGTTTHLSPEQTGRLNRWVDCRSDLYALGVTFYEMLTGYYPFYVDNQADLIYCHLAKPPVDIQLYKPGLPLVFVRMIHRLLEKNPDDRYQTARGLRLDLERCANNWSRNQDWTMFELATDDQDGSLLISPKLYGRDTELKKMSDAFEVVFHGRAMLVLLSGSAGVGKSALVRELQPLVGSKNGFYAEGKFDQFLHNKPFSVWIQAFSSFVNSLLCLDGDDLLNWKSVILNSLASNGRLLTDLVPKLELVIGPQPSVPELAGKESQNRFAYVMLCFIDAIATPEHPLVVFLDDLQWIDSASLMLLNLVFEHHSSRSIMVVGAYRENELWLQHPLKASFQHYVEHNVTMLQLELGNLQEKDICALLRDSLRCSESDAEPLAHLLHTKTAGNAFFANQLLHTLVDNELLVYDKTEHRWDWDIEDIQTLDISDNVVDLMISKIQALTPDVQLVLKQAACIGSRFQVPILAMIAQQSPLELQHLLLDAVNDGLLLPYQTSYKFAHDRIQQAAYSLLEESERGNMHYAIGKVMLEKIDLSEREKFVFDIVGQFNRGLFPNHDTQVRESLVRLNLNAGLKAKASTAYSAALTYFETGINMLNENAWSCQYVSALALYNEAAEAAYMSGQYERMRELAAQVHQNAHSILEEVAMYEVEMKALTAQVKLMASIRLGLEVLAKLGLDIPEEPSWDEVWLRFGSALTLLQKQGVEGLGGLPEMVSPEIIAQTRILSDIGEPAYAAAPSLFLVWASVYAEICFHQKHVSLSPFAYGAFALALCATGQYLALGNELGRYALKAVESFEARSSKTRVMNIYGGTVQFWVEPLRDTIVVMEEAVASGMEYGDHISGGYSALGMSLNLFFMGDPLSITANKLLLNYKSILGFRQHFLHNWVASYWRAAQILRNEDLDDETIHGTEAQLWVNEASDNNNIGLLGHFYLSALVVAYHLEQDDDLMSVAKKARENMQGFQSTICVPAFYFYESLALLRLGLYKEYKERIDSNQKALMCFSEYAACNFKHKYQLVAAEIAKFEGDQMLAARLYDEAIRGAAQNAYLQDEALGHELSGLFYDQNEIQTGAQFHFTEAYRLYKNWEAKAKLLLLHRNYGQYLGSLLPQVSLRAEIAENIDIESIIKASRAISGEIELEKLLASLMKVIVENAGAQLAFFIFKNKDIWQIEASYDITDKVHDSFHSHPYSECPDISSSIINYVIRTKQPLVLNDASRFGAFVREPYIQTRQTRSVLCCPLKIKGTLNAILYLENNLIANAFNQRRMEVFEILVAQAAVSLENALYFREMKSLNVSLNNEIQVRKEVEDELRTSEAKFRLLADHSTDIISRNSLDNLTYLYVSPSCVHVLGYLPEEMIGYSAYDFIHPEDVPAVREALEQVMAGTDHVFVCFRKRKKNGNWLWVESNSMVIRDKDTQEPIELQSSSRDISERKQAEDEIMKNEFVLKQQNEEFLALNEELSESNARYHLMNDELIKAKNKAEESDRLKSAFLANISHEIRTPMNGILGFSGLLKNPNLSGDKQNMYIDLITQSGNRMMNIINDLVYISKLEAGITDLAYEQVDLQALVHEIYTFFEGEARAKNLDLRLEVPPVQFMFKTDATKLNQILTNLIKNALKFTDSGFILIGYTIKKKGIEFYVKDSGIGIEKDQQALIFHRFIQVDNRLSKPYEGAGLGLSISKGFVEMLGGKIWLESDLGQGSIFYFDLPFDGHSEVAVSAALPQYPIPEPRVNKGITVLVVDDDPTNQLFFAEALGYQGVNIIQAFNGLESVELVKARSDIALVLMDIKMPGMSGEMALPRIKALRPELAVIAQTAYRMENDREKFLELGFDNYIAKPICIPELMSLIKDYVS